jgi:hypothetical protein
MAQVLKHPIVHKLFVFVLIKKKKCFLYPRKHTYREGEPAQINTFPLEVAGDIVTVNA